MATRWMTLGTYGHQYRWPDPTSVSEVEVKLNTGEVYTAHHFYEEETGVSGWSHNGVKLKQIPEIKDYWRELYNAGQFPEGLI